MISQKTIGLFLFSCFLFSSCLKNKDSTGNGPKSPMTITNYVVNGASFDVFFDDTKITTAPLTFGDSTSTASSAYFAFGAGVHNFKLTSGADQIANNSFALEAGKNYSFFLFDTLKNKQVKSWLLTDDLTAVDTLAKARFLQFIPIPSTDSLTILLTKDTLIFAVGDTYIGNKSAPGTEGTFFINMPPGNYEIQLQKGTTILYQQASFTVLPGKLYSFIARGVIGGTGVYKERISVVQQN